MWCGGMGCEEGKILSFPLVSRGEIGGHFLFELRAYVSESVGHAEE